MSLVDSRLVLAPMSGGPGTVALAAAVGRSGGFAFLPGADIAPRRLRDDVRALREALGARPFGVNLLVPTPGATGSTAAVAAYAAVLEPWAESAGILLGTPRWDDDDVAAKVEVVLAERPAVVSFACAWPAADLVERLRSAGVEVWVTVNAASEVDWALELEVDGVIAQGWQAGGLRCGPVDTGGPQPGTGQLLHDVRRRTSLPVIAAGGVGGPDDLAALVGLGAHAVACGTAYLCADEAGTAPVHRHALTHRSGTVVTRAFTGRSGRALTTTWTELHGEGAPAAYPQVHRLTAPLREHGAATGQPDLVDLWAGTGHSRCESAPAARITARLLGR